MLDDIENRGLPGDDGHVSAKVMVRHMGKLSSGEAAEREKCRRRLNRLPAVAAAYGAGEVGTDQVRLLGRVHANRRVAAHLTRYQNWFLDKAKNLDFVEFEAVIRQWERLIDQDGAELAAERAHRDRDFTSTQDHFGLGWEIKGGTGPLAGAAMSEIFEHYPPTAAVPSPATGHHCVDATTDGNKEASPSGATPRVNGTPTAPTAPKSPSRPRLRNPDDTTGRFYDDPIGWLVLNEITTGTSPTTFDPDRGVTSGELATFLFRFARASRCPS